MMKKTFLFCLTLLLLAVLPMFAASAEKALPSVNGALHVEGTQLTDQNGQPVQLRGVSTHGLSWFPQYVNPECFAELKDGIGVNVIRLAMYTAEYGGYCTGGDQEALRLLVKKGVEYAVENDLYVIVDWHILYDNDPRTHTEEAIAFFDEMSRELAGIPNVIYELCNEPNGNVTFADIREYSLQVIPVIRANAPDALILVGTPSWCQKLDQAAADPITGYDNLMYCLHFYAATHGQYLRDVLTDALAKGLPVFVSEYGLCAADGYGDYNIAESEKWMELLDANNISHVQWSIANQDSKCSIFKTGEEKISGFTHDDLSTSGLWLAERLGGSLADPNAKAATAPEKQLSADNNLCGDPTVWDAYIDTDAGGDAAMLVSDGIVTVTVSSGGKNAWSVQPNYQGLTLELMGQYVLSFTIETDTAIQFDVTLQQNYSPYGAYKSMYGLTMDPGTKTFNTPFTMVSRTDENVSLCFNIGANPGSYQIVISDVVLKRTK